MIAGPAATPRAADLLRLLRAQAKPPRIPGATYRLQFHAGFTFRDAKALIPYLHALGVTDVYASPYLKARTGSSHGYDVANPNALNPEIGSEEDYRAYVDELAKYGMGQVLDTVPNHMGIGDATNAWWQDVLENGPASVYADFFDVDWSPITAELHDSDKVVLPILGDQYGRVLENGELSLALEDDGLFVRYYDFRLPLAPESYIEVLGAARERLQQGRVQSQPADLARLDELIDGLRKLPPRRRTDYAGRQERNRGKELIKSQLAALCEDSSTVRRALRQVLTALNGRRGQPSSFDALDRLLNQQSYRLAYWRVAAEEINYRRFFDINDLAAVRVEDPQVFQATHALLLVLIGLGAVTGIRIDHPDGLRDPGGHMWRLQRACFIERHRDAVNDAFPSDTERVAIEEALGAAFDELRCREPDADELRAIYMVVEKILSADEQLPRDWPVHGTTGYDFLNQVNGIFVNRDSRAAFDAIYSRFAGVRERYSDLSNSTRKMVMLVSLPGEVNGLAYRLKQLASLDRRYRDFTLNALTFAVRELIACLPVYRTYIDTDTGAISAEDRHVIEQATAEVKLRNPRTDPTIFDFIRDQLLGANDSTPGTRDAQRLAFVARFQQVSGPVMAKGAEDTAFYRYNRLVSLNEVGGDPGQFGWSVSAFHRANLARLTAQPHSMLASSTHDSKRSEDVRARLNLLSELPRQWRAALNRWSRLNARHKVGVDGRPAPDRNDEYLLYQTLLGVWPLEEPDGRGYRELCDRVVAAMLKAVKEAKVNTSWINPNTSYEAAVEGFVRGILGRDDPNPFLEDFLQLAQTIANLGMFNSLSQTLLKCASPGMPDLYQGNEIWDFSLVDPDNRRAVDYRVRQQLLAEVQRRAEADRAAFAEELLHTREDGRIKLYLTQRCFHTRQACLEVFTHGAYQPLRSRGPESSHVCAFARVGRDGRAVLVVAPVLVAGLLRGAAEPVGDVWGSTGLLVPARFGRSFRDLFTGERVEAEARGRGSQLAMSEVLRRFPVALLEAA